jgi:hypothetical protein
MDSAEAWHDQFPKQFPQFNTTGKMTSETPFTTSETLDINDLESAFLSLRIGEEIPRLTIKAIRKLTNPSKTDNLPGVDYKYLIEASDGKILMVNSWILWKRISAVLRNAGRIGVTLFLKHDGREDYVVKETADT